MARSCTRSRTSWWVKFSSWRTCGRACSATAGSCGSAASIRPASSSWGSRCWRRIRRCGARTIPWLWLRLGRKTPQAEPSHRQKHEPQQRDRHERECVRDERERRGVVLRHAIKARQRIRDGRVIAAHAAGRRDGEAEDGPREDEEGDGEGKYEVERTHRRPDLEADERQQEERGGRAHEDPAQRAERAEAVEEGHEDRLELHADLRGQRLQQRFYEAVGAVGLRREG